MSTNTMKTSTHPPYATAPAMKADGPRAAVKPPKIDTTLDRAEQLIYTGETHRTVELANWLLAPGAGVDGDRKGRCLLIRAAALRLRGFPDPALEDASAALNLFNPNTSDPRFLAQAHKQIGILLAMRGDLSGAIEHFEVALGWCARAADLNLEADIHVSFGITSARVGRYAETQVHYQSAIVAYEKSGRHAERATLLNNIGRLHHDLGEYAVAIGVYEKSLALAQQFRYARTESMALVNMGDARRELGDLTGALSAYRSAIETATLAQEPRVNCCANVGIGVTYRLMAQMENARFHLEQAIYEAGRLKLGWELADARLEAALLEIAANRLHEAEKLLLLSLHEFERLGAQPGVARASVFLADIYRRTSRRRELASILRALNSTVSNPTIDRRLIRDAHANREALTAAIPRARNDTLLASLRKAIPDHPETGIASVRRKGLDREHELRIEVRTLGTFRVAMEGNDVPPGSWESRKAQELFVLLLCRRNGKTSEELLEMLWPESETVQKRDVIHNNVYRIRRTLYRGCLLLENGHYQINPREQLWFDLDEFRRLSDAASTERYSPRKAELLTQANQLYRGDFLAGFYSEWVLDVRRQTELQYLTNLTSLVSLQVEVENLAAARSTVRQIIDVDPANEFAHRMTIAIQKSNR